MNVCIILYTSTVCVCRCHEYNGTVGEWVSNPIFCYYWGKLHMQAGQQHALFVLLTRAGTLTYI